MTYDLLGCFCSQKRKKMPKLPNKDEVSAGREGAETPLTEDCDQ